MKGSNRYHSHNGYRVLSLLLVLFSVLLVTPALQVHPGRLFHTGALLVPTNARSARFHLLSPAQTPPSDASCRVTAKIPCYSPQEIRTAYGLAPFIDAGYTGRGQTIVIIDSFGSPTIVQDLHVFDRGYGLPDPPSFRILSPLGTVPFNPASSDQVGWAYETTLDVEWAHAIAPGANIVLLTSPISETEGTQGLPEFLQLEQYAVNHHLGKIISQSWGATENTLFTPAGKMVFSNFNQFYRNAAASHVTIFASSGDSGVANLDLSGKTYPFPTVLFPASSPWVTSVGGTSLYASTAGMYLSETVWNQGLSSASGGGISQYFAEPEYQQNFLPAKTRAQLKGFRGVPDVAYNGDPNTAILIYSSFLGPQQSGYFYIGGTSEGAPQWSGIAAIANQKAGRPLGFLNPTLYKLGRRFPGMVFHDVVVGNNSQPGITGYTAMPGWDLTTGWGSPMGTTLINKLIHYAP